MWAATARRAFTTKGAIGFRPAYNYGELINVEVPAVIDFVRTYSGCRAISWIGYSLGGWSPTHIWQKYPANPIKNLVTIASPMALNQILFRFIPFINFTSRILGFEEDALLGNLSQNLVPLTRGIRALAGLVCPASNLISPVSFQPPEYQQRHCQNHAWQHYRTHAPGTSEIFFPGSSRPAIRHRRKLPII